MIISEIKMPKDMKPGQADPIKLDPDKISSIFKFIRKNCSEFLNEGVKTTRKFLYRGMPLSITNGEKIVLGQSPTFRKSLSLFGNHQATQFLCDRYLLAAGFNAVRSNSIFSTSDIHRSSDYGNMFATFPINGFKFTYSTENPNTNASGYEYPYTPDDILSTIEQNNTLDQPLKIELRDPKLFSKYAQKFVKENGFYNTDLASGMQLDCDIFFVGKYIAVENRTYKNDLREFLRKI